MGKVPRNEADEVLIKLNMTPHPSCYAIHLPRWGRVKTFCILHFAFCLPPGGSKAKPSPLTADAELPQSGSLLKPLTSGEVAPKVTERADPEVPEPAGETGGFCEAKDEGRVRVVRHLRKLLHR